MNMNDIGGRVKANKPVGEWRHKGCKAAIGMTLSLSAAAPRV